MSGKKDFYELLGVDKSASKDEIKKAYRKLAMKHHPDRNPGAENEAKFKEVSEAAQVLLDENKRKAYDQFGHAGVDGQGAGGFGGGFGGQGDFSDLGDIFGDIFGDFFGGGGGGRRRGGRSRARGGRDLEMALNISFEEAAFGTEKKVSVRRNVSCSPCGGSGAAKGSSPEKCDYCNGMGEIRRQQGFFTVASACPKCQGTGEVIKNPCRECHGKGTQGKNADLSVKIPAGINTHQRLKLSGEGDTGQFGGPSGDLYVLIEVDEHDIFERDDYDVHCTLPISISEAALGSEMEVPTLSGKVVLNIPAGTQSGKKMRLKGKGISRLGGYGIGDQIVSIHVETPTKLTARQRELFEQLAEEEGKQTNPMSRGFFEKVKELFQ